MGNWLMALLDGAEKHWQVLTAVGALLAATVKWTWPNVVVPMYRITLQPLGWWIYGMATLPTQVHNLAKLAISTANTLNQMNEVLSNGGEHGMADHVLMLKAQQRLMVMDKAGWVANAQGENVQVDPGFTELLGWTDEDMRGDGWRRLLHPEEAGEYLAAWEHSLAEVVPFVMPHPKIKEGIRFQTAAKSWLRVRVRAVPTVKPVNGAVRWCGVIEPVPNTTDWAQGRGAGGSE